MFACQTSNSLKNTAKSIFRYAQNGIMYNSNGAGYYQNRFMNKVVIVTGSTSGIGQAAAIRFAQEGGSVTIHGRNPEGMQETTELLKEEGVPGDRILQVYGDVVEANTQQELVNRTVEAFGGIDVVVNNAGAPAEEAGMSMAELESLDHVLEVILKSHIRLTAFALPFLQKRGGNVVNVSSVDGVKPHPDSINYSMAKAALDHYCRNASVLFADKGVRINNLNPGYIDTNIKLRGGRTQEDLKRFENLWVKNNVPMKRPGTSAEMANIIAFLASDEASFMTGSIVVADGGLQHYMPSQKV